MLQTIRSEISTMPKAERSLSQIDFFFFAWKQILKKLAEQQVWQLLRLNYN
jgi:hypothetical protein